MQPAASERVAAGTQASGSPGCDGPGRGPAIREGVGPVALEAGSQGRKAVVGDTVVAGHAAALVGTAGLLAAWLLGLPAVLGGEKVAATGAADRAAW